jgi:hypothetical protein
LLGLSPDSEVQQVQVWRIWWPICQSSEFCQQLLGGPGGVGQHLICRKTCFPSAYAVSKGLGRRSALTRLPEETSHLWSKFTRPATHSASVTSFLPIPLFNSFSHPTPNLYHHLDCRPSVFANLAPHSPPMVAEAGPQQEVHN